MACIYFTNVTACNNNDHNIASLLLRRWKKAIEMKCVASQQFSSLVANVQGLLNRHFLSIILTHMYTVKVTVDDIVVKAGLKMKRI